MKNIIIKVILQLMGIVGIFFIALIGCLSYLNNAIVQKIENFASMLNVIPSDKLTFLGMDVLELTVEKINGVNEIVVNKSSLYNYIPIFFSMMVTTIVLIIILVINEYVKRNKYKNMNL